MYATIIGIVTLFALPATSGQATEVATTATVVAADGVASPQIRTVGRLNINTASRDQLLKVPGLEASHVDAIIVARDAQEVTDLNTLSLPEASKAHLKTEGDSNFYRIQQNPLVRFAKR
jgi:DNA uptake protein ComE-like DNA-binding protein